jgi:uncharacterized lipoprotein YddW (UPF0748 family)
LGAAASALGAGSGRVIAGGAGIAGAGSQAGAERVFTRREVRGTWLTTTANRAIASPADTQATMRRLREIGLNTVYVEAWKNGYTQFPSEVLRRTLGVAQRPPAALQDPGDAPSSQTARDLLSETLVAAHREGLIHVAWFEYGFMAAHQHTMNHLRRLKPDWLSRDIRGNEVAPNGFVWLNPLHPEARRFLTDLVLEAVDHYDLDGIQLDDRIVWPHVTMGYDEFTRRAYAAAHKGREPPSDARDPAWMRWRAEAINTLAREFVAELRQRRPGLLMSLSPAVYPWSYEHYLLEWPQWARWRGVVRWDEFVPQAYRHSYAAFEKTWLEQVQALQATGAYRPQALLSGLRLVGEGPDSSWEQLRDSILHTASGQRRPCALVQPRRARCFQRTLDGVLCRQRGIAPLPQRLAHRAPAFAGTGPGRGCLAVAAAAGAGAWGLARDRLRWPGLARFGPAPARAGRQCRAAAFATRPARCRTPARSPRSDANDVRMS